MIHNDLHLHRHRNFDQCLLDRYLMHNQFDLFAQLLERMYQHQHHHKRSVLEHFDRFLLSKQFDLFVQLLARMNQHQHHRKMIEQSVIGRFRLSKQFDSIVQLDQQSIPHLRSGKLQNLWSLCLDCMSLPNKRFGSIDQSMTHSIQHQHHHKRSVL